jgi:hypothetical protein
MLRNLIVCGFALAGLLLLTADASAFGGKRRSSCSSGCSTSSCATYAAPAPVYYAPPPPPQPVAAPCYTCQSTSYASSCGGHCGRGHGHRGKRGCH